MKQYCILIIDDEEDMLRYLEKSLSPFYNIYKAMFVSAGMKFLSQDVIHLIVCDVMMPLTDGYTFCKQIKEDPNLSHIPIILLTARNSIRDKIDGLECGADVYMEKPFSKQHLIAQISSILENRAKILEHFVKSPIVSISSLSVINADQEFLKVLSESISNNLDNIELDVVMLARLLNMSRTTLYRKIVSVTGITPTELINVSRLKTAAKLLTENKYKIYEISYMVGYYSQSSFSRNFQKQFGKTPKQYLNDMKNANL